MLSHSEVEKILGDWIVYATEHEMTEKKKELWLLYDYLEQDFSRDFYEHHYDGAIAAIEKLDTEKGSVREVREYLLPIIGKYKSLELF